MASQIPDARSLESWGDAFQHPLPVVRKLEQQLRKNIDDDRQKLRSLVGGSYRDLLGTAERIIEMDDQMQGVETYLGDIGKKCNARTAERIVENQARMRKTTLARDGGRHGAIAQTKVLQNALTMLSRTIKSGGDALLAAKLHVLVRVLYKSISENDEALPVLEVLRQKLATLRKKLLLYIERTLVKHSPDKALLANTLCAYSLATSSNLKEVLRFFLRVRYVQLDRTLDSPSESDFLKMLESYSQTVLDCRDLFPRRIADSLLQLAKVPLLRDEQVRSVAELNLDIYGSWIAEDVRTFTPWVRHDQLSAAEVADALGSWSSQAQDCMLQGLEEYLKQQDDVSAIVESRSKVISRYMLLANQTRNTDLAQNIRLLRAVFLRKLEELTTRTASTVGVSIDDLNATETLEQLEVSIWDLATDNLDLSHGAFKFRESILRRRHGRSNRIQVETDKLRDWTKRIEDFIGTIDTMTAARWDDDLDLDFDDLDEGDSLQKGLTVKDPAVLRSALRKATQTVFADIVARITTVADETKHAAFFLRLWREVDQGCQGLESRLDLQFSIPSAGALYRNIAISVAQNVIKDYVQSAQATFRPAVTLWDGSPPLPVQPSPTVFKFLTQLHRAMAEAGTDLWSAQCVTELKQLVLTSLATGLDGTALTNLKDQPAMINGHVEAEEEPDREDESDQDGANDNEDSVRNQMLQNLFDVLYLQRALDRGKQHAQEGGLVNILQSLRKTLDLNESPRSRLERSASEYWKKTYLLFGLLATSNE